MTGGLQRDCIVISQKLRSLGHDVTIFCARQEGSLPRELSVRVLPNNHRTNHGRNFAFSEAFRNEIGDQYDCVIGFNALEGLDIHYCGDPPIFPIFPFYHLLPRFRTRRNLERQCFGADSKTLNLLLNEKQALLYEGIWATPYNRIGLIPPNVEIERRKPQLRSERWQIRQRLGYTDSDWVWLAIATQPHTKGVDRTLRALKKFPNAKLMFVGSPGYNTTARASAELVHRLDLERRVKWLGHREDVPEIMAAADIFIHPARVDTTGKIILEAVINGLPAIVASVCGYSPHIASASAGVVLSHPFSAREFVKALELASNPRMRDDWSVNGQRYGKLRKDLYTGFEYAVDLTVRHANAKVKN